MKEHLNCIFNCIFATVATSLIMWVVGKKDRVLSFCPRSCVIQNLPITIWNLLARRALIAIVIMRRRATWIRNT